MTDHIPTLQRIYAAFAAGDLPGVLAHLSPDIDWEHDRTVPVHPLFRPGRGYARVMEFFTELARDWEFLQFEPQGFLAGGDRIAVPIRLGLRNRTTGREAHDLEIHLWTFGPDGKVAALRHCVDTAQLQAASPS